MDGAVAQNYESEAGAGSGNDVMDAGEELGGEMGVTNDAVPPHDGLVFKTAEEAFTYYEDYARRAGFGIKCQNSTYFDDGRCRYLILACNKDGAVKYKSEFHSCKPTKKTNCMAKIHLRHREDDGLLHIKQLVLEHNHPLAPGTVKSFRTRKRKRYLIDNANSGSLKGKFVGKLKKQSLAEKNSDAKFEAGDAELLHRFFVRMQTKDPSFFHLADFNDKGCMKNVFWADGRSRTAYQYFGDIVLFDTTCLIEKYDVPLVSFVGVNHHGQKMLLGCGLLWDQSSDSYRWLFKTWFACMFGREPCSLISDRCDSIQAAVADVFPDVNHRQCLWHIMKRIAHELQGMEKFKEFKTTLKTVLFDSLSAEEFEDGWGKMSEEFQLRNNKWFVSLYDDRRHWAPVFVKQRFWAGMSVSTRQEGMVSFFDEYIHRTYTLWKFLGKYELILERKYEREIQADTNSLYRTPQLLTRFYFEEQLNKVYTTNMFRKFQAEVRGLMYCVTYPDDVAGQVCSSFKVKERIRVKNSRTMESKIHGVKFDRSEMDVQCNCYSFEYRGILCRHVLSVLSFQNVFEIPSKYILDRWRKDFKQMYAISQFCTKTVAMDNREQCYGNLYKCCLKLSEIGLTSNDRLEFASKVVDEGIEKILIDDELHGANGTGLSPVPTTSCHVMRFDINVDEIREQGIETTDQRHYQFLDNRGNALQQSVVYHNRSEWNLPQYLQENQTSEPTPATRPL